MKKKSKIPDTPLEIREEKAFRTWLARGMGGLQERSIADVCSRLRRVMSMASIKLAATTTAELESTLLRSDAYLKCTPSVRSQLKRAANLYLSFVQGKTLLK